MLPFDTYARPSKFKAHSSKTLIQVLDSLTHTNKFHDSFRPGRERHGAAHKHAEGREQRAGVTDAAQRIAAARSS